MILGSTAALLGALSMASCGGGGSSGGSMATTTMTSGFVGTSLVSNVNSASNPYSGSNADLHLVNAWGIAFNPQGFVWVANNGTSTSTLYDGDGVPQSLVVSIPAGKAGPAKPTGIVFNGSSAFAVTQGGVSGASAFIFAGEGGTISGWSPDVNMTNAVIAVDNSATGKIYKGLAIGSVGGAPRLYAADFHNGVVEREGSSVHRRGEKGGRPPAVAQRTRPATFAPDQFAMGRASHHAGYEQRAHAGATRLRDPLRRRSSNSAVHG
jgi:uncharacterized protein (TIGR03118 family)